MGDLIKREDAIKAIDDAFDSIPMEQTTELLKVRRAIRVLPSADRPQGEWEKIGEDTYYYRCPYCKRIRAFKDSRFCDWCGARMKGADDE